MNHGLKLTVSMEIFLTSRDYKSCLYFARWWRPGFCCCFDVASLLCKTTKVFANVRLRWALLLSTPPWNLKASSASQTGLAQRRPDALLRPRIRFSFNVVWRLTVDQLQVQACTVRTFEKIEKVWIVHYEFNLNWKLTMSLCWWKVDVLMKFPWAYRPVLQRANVYNTFTE